MRSRQTFSPAIDQAAVILKLGKQKEIARQFLIFLNRQDIAEFMRGNGLNVPETQPK